MEKKRFLLLALLAATLGVLPACGSSSDNTPVVTQVPQVLHSLRAYETEVYDHYYEFSKIRSGGELLAEIVRYAAPDRSKRTQDWKKTLTPLQSKSLHVTGTLVHGTKLYLVGYHTLSMDTELSNLVVNSRANGFLVEVDTRDGTILGSTVILSETEVPESVVIPLSIALDGEEIRITGESTGGIVVGSTHLQPESARDAFTIFFNPEDGRVVSASLTPLVTSPPVRADVRNAASAEKGSEMSGARTGVVGAFLGNFEATAGANWVQSTILRKLGFQNATAKALGEVNTQLTKINTQLTNIDNNLDTLLKDFACIFNEMLKQNTTIAGDLNTYFQKNIQTYFTTYLGAVNVASQPVTLQSVYAKPGTFIDNFYTSKTAIEKLNSSLNNLLGTLQGEGGLPASMYNQITQLVQEIPNASCPGSKPNFDGYNEGLMNLYGTVIQAIQIVYTIQSTYIYVGSADPNDANNTDANPQMPDWDVGVSGVLNTQSYSTNQSNLNAYYENQIQTIFNDVAQYLITDFHNTLPSQAMSDGFTVNYSSSFLPVKANTLQGMPTPGTSGEYTPSNAQSWTTGCSIYVWKGAVADPSTTDYAGSWENNQMTVRCPAVGGEPLSLDLSNIQPGGGLTTAGVNYFHMDSGLQGDPIDLLQPAPPAIWASSYVGTIFNPTNFDTEFGYGQMKVHAKDYISIYPQNWDGWPASTTDFAGNSYVTESPITWGPASSLTMNPGQYQFNDDHGTTGWIIFDYLSPQGLSYYFWLGLETDCKGINKICVQVQCGKPADPNICAQAQGFDYGAGIVFAGKGYFAGYPGETNPTVTVCTDGTGSEHANLSPGYCACSQGCTLP